MNGASSNFGDAIGRVEAIEQFDRQTQLMGDQALQVSEGPSYLATQTGGFYFRNPSDTGLVLERSLEDQRGYYLIGYSPDAKTIDEDRRGRPFHNLEVRLKRRGLSVHSRKGFLGGQERTGAPSPSATLVDAALSPFSGGTLDPRLTGFFAGSWRGTPIIRAFVYLDARALEFQGSQTNDSDAYVELLALVTDQAGEIVARDRQMMRLRTQHDVRAEGGLVYRFDIPVDKPGPYGLRVAVRETATNRVGAVNQFVLVPDLARKELALSGIVLTANAPGTDAGTSSEAVAPAGEMAGTSHPGVRRFAVPADVAYTFQIFNARYSSDGKPSLRADRPPSARRAHGLYRADHRRTDRRDARIAGQRRRLALTGAADGAWRLRPVGDRDRRPCAA